jgi:hypothetical protein
MRKGTKVQILDRNHPLFLMYGYFQKNKFGKKVVIKVRGVDIVLPKGSIEEA